MNKLLACMSRVSGSNSKRRIDAIAPAVPGWHSLPEVLPLIEYSEIMALRNLSNSLLDN